MGVWDINTPIGVDPVSQVDDRIRELKTALQEALRGGTTDGLEAKFPGAAPSTAPVFHYRGLKGTTGSRPTAGEYGLYFNTTRNVLQRDNDSTWDDIGTVIPAGTVMCFYQAAAPTGWTQVVTQNDKVLRVVSSAGGGAGGTIATSTSLAHSHGGLSHTHALTLGAVAAGAGGNGLLSGTTSSSSPSTDSQLAGALAYIDILLASKD